MIASSTRAAVIAGALLVADFVGAATSAPPLALRGVNPDRLSGGLFSALDASGAFGALPPPPRARLGTADLSKGHPPLVLDPRVGVNVRVGDDPAALPSTQRGQAEPHIARSAVDSNLLLATFQEGRFSDSGSLDCGYGVSQDGGLTWTRALIPQLTAASGGNFNRATDPVAAIGPQGDLYLNTLGSVSGAFDLAAVVVSRSTDRGATWGSPVVVFQSSTNTVSPDKNWLAVNDFPGTANTGRLVATWTNFTSTPTGASTGSNLLAAVSDDRGATWSVPAAITPAGTLNQGSQPVFLPDGSLLVVYITFANASTTTQFSIACKRSTDGGLTFPATGTTVAPVVIGWDDPDLRDGVFLPAIAVARQSGDVFVTYTAVVNGSPRVLVTKSNDRGTTWSTPVTVSDNPAGVSVVNPAIATSSDGRTVSAVFADKRNAADGHNFIDQYAAVSLDGGLTWQPNLRLTEFSSDIRYAPATTRGYMFGDYEGVAPAPDATEACVAVFCDTRSGDSDPFTVRFTPAATPNFTSWAIARALPPDQPAADSDGDGFMNAVEFQLGTNPRVRESGETFVIRQPAAGVFDVAWVERISSSGYSVTTVANPPASGIVDAAVGGTALPADQLPSVPAAGDLHWVGTRFNLPAGAAFTAGHALKFSTSIPPFVSGERAAANGDARLINVSTRGVAGTGANQMIVGFVTDGLKSMLVRAGGPALVAFGVNTPLAATQLILTTSSGSILATNAGWQQGTASGALFTRLGAYPFAAGSGDSALFQTLPGGGYTAVASGANGSTGVALVEAYDADPAPGATSNPRLLNLSTRGALGTGDASLLIAGFVISGTQPRRMLIRAIGPTLSAFGVTGALADPQLTLNGSTGVIATNDDWQISRSGPAVAATAQRLGAFALNDASLDAALLITLSPGAYTVTMSGVNGASGIGLLEVYDAN